MRRSGWSCCLGILILVAFSVDSRAAGPPAHKPNIVLITIDSARADRMGFLGAHSGLTPNLDTLAGQSIVFAQVYAQSPSTVTSHAVVLTGSYPQINRTGEFGIPLPASLPYLPSLFHAAGYRTAAFAGSLALDPHNGPFQRYDRGFDAYDAGFHEPQLGQSRYQSVQRRGEEVAARAAKWLGANKLHPFFLWINFSDPAGAVPGTYDRALAAADAAAGRVLHLLRTASLYDGAVIVFAAPHGESLGAHGEDRHGFFLYDETMHVPLLVKLAANRLAGKQVKNRVRLLDIAPTLLEAAALAISPQMQGQSLVRVAQSGSQADPPAYARSDFPHQGFQCSALESWRAGKYLYIRAPTPELYDLTADPNAAHNLAASSKGTLDTLASQLQSFDSRLGGESVKAGAAVLTSSEMQKLASLGYVGLQKSGTNANAGAEGTDPKTAIAAANKILAALDDVNDGKPEKAIPALKQGLAAQESYLAELGMGTALQQQQRFADAIPFLHKAIELQPDSPWAHYSMGQSLGKTGDFKSAVVHLQIAASRLPEFSDAEAALADAQKQADGRK